MQRGVVERLECLAQRRLQRAVHLDHVQVRHLRGEELGEHAEPAADLQHHVGRVELGGGADHAQDVVVDQEVLAELPVGADPEGAQPPQARLARLAAAHGPSTRAAFASTIRSSSSYSLPRSSATKRAVWVTFAGSFGLPRSGCGER